MIRTNWCDPTVATAFRDHFAHGFHISAKNDAGALVDKHGVQGMEGSLFKQPLEYLARYITKFESIQAKSE